MITAAASAPVTHVVPILYSPGDRISRVVDPDPNRAGVRIRICNSISDSDPDVSQVLFPIKA